VTKRLDRIIIKYSIAGDITLVYGKIIHAVAPKWNYTIINCLNRIEEQKLKKEGQLTITDSRVGTLKGHIPMEESDLYQAIQQYGQLCCQRERFRNEGNAEKYGLYASKCDAVMKRIETIVGNIKYNCGNYGERQWQY